MAGPPARAPADANKVDREGGCKHLFEETSRRSESWSERAGLGRPPAVLPIKLVGTSAALAPKPTSTARSSSRCRYLESTEGLLGNEIDDGDNYQANRIANDQPVPQFRKNLVSECRVAEVDESRYTTHQCYSVSRQ